MDAVIVWMDTEGKEYRRERIRYLADNPEGGGGIGQDRGMTEFLLCLGAIMRNLPEVKRIFVLSATKTDTPEKFLQMNFADSETEVRTISFDELFTEEMEGFLPCFSSISATTQLYRLNSMDDSFILFEIGCIPVRKMDMGRFRKEGKAVCYGTWERSEAISGRRKERLFIPGRLPFLMSRKALGNCLASNPGLLTANLRHRFDNPRSRRNPDGQIDLRLLLANSHETMTVDAGRESRDHGTMVQRLVPGDDRPFFKAMEKARTADFIDIAPFRYFGQAQRRAIIDFLCHILQIRLP